MRRSVINVMVGLFIAVVFGLTGCGGGGGNGGTPSVTSVKTSQVGKYSLVQIDESKSHQWVPFSAYSSTTSTPPAWTGTMKAGNTSWNVAMSAMGQTSTVNGSYNFTAGANQSGTFGINIPGYAGLSGTYNILDDYTLKLTYNPVANGLGCIKWVETWHKDSDTP